MKKQLLILSIALITSLGFYSCKKKYQIIPAPTPTSGIRDSFAKLQLDNIQTRTISGFSGGSFETAGGLKVQVPASAFSDVSGIPIAGNVNIEIKEMLTPSEMIFNEKSTTSNGEVLVTGGQFKISYTTNGNPVYIRGGYQLNVQVPTNIGDNNMQVFYGAEDETGFVNWTQAMDTSLFPQPIPAVLDTSGTSYNFALDSLSANWINCDYFYSVSGAKTKLTVSLPEEYNNSNTMFFMNFNTIQSVMNGYFDGTNFVSSGQIPVGTDLQLILISEIDGDFYYKGINISVGNNHKSTLVLDPSTYDDIEKAINNL
ncbi:MAG: hypothetical protein AB8B74_12855 [Crocinitomicaceae bacterium]